MQHNSCLVSDHSIVCYKITEILKMFIITLNVGPSHSILVQNDHEMFRFCSVRG